MLNLEEILTNEFMLENYFDMEVDAKAVVGEF